MTPETIEIGAVKMNAYGDVLGQYRRFVRPVLHPQLSLFCRRLTNIDQVDINRAAEFPEVAEDFMNWIDIWGEEDYLLCAWGGFDQRLLFDDCDLHRMEDEWVEPFINVKRQYIDLKRLHRPRGLKRTVEVEGFEFTGDHHRALPDAQNLAKVFHKYLDMWQY